MLFAGEVVVELLGWEWTSDEVALTDVGAERSEHFEDLIAVDTLGDDGEVESAGQLDGGADDGVSAAVGVQVGDEGFVDLEFVDGHLEQL